MNILETPSDKLLAGIRTLLAVKGIATADEVAERIRITDSASPRGGRRWWRAPGPSRRSAS